MAIWGVEHDALEAGPCLKRSWFPLLSRIPEAIDKAAENRAALYLLLRRLSHRRDFVKNAHANLPKDLVDFLEGFRGTIHRLGHIAISTSLKSVASLRSMITVLKDSIGGVLSHGSEVSGLGSTVCAKTSLLVGSRQRSLSLSRGHSGRPHRRVSLPSIGGHLAVHLLL